MSNRKPRPAAPPKLEVLEDRLVPSTFTVDNTNDRNAGDRATLTGDLRWCIGNAAPGDTIMVQPGLTGTIQLSDTLTIAKSLSISGPGPDLLTVSGLGPDTYNSDFDVASGTTVSLSGLTITNGGLGGLTNAGTLTLSNCAVSGNLFHGITNIGGTLTVRNCTISDNTHQADDADFGGAGIATAGGTVILSDSTIARNESHGPYFEAAGGGIYAGVGHTVNSHPTLIVNNCTFWDNKAIDDQNHLAAFGGAIAAVGSQTTVSNSTFYGNTADLAGGAIYTRSTLLTVTNCTIVGNSAVLLTHVPSGGGGIFADGDDGMGGLWPGSQPSLRNTILAQNVGGDFGPDYILADEGNLGRQVSSLGHNLIGSANTADITGWAASDLIGTSTSPIDPLVGPLQNNGGPTQTMALLLGSPAIDGGDPDPTGLPAYDQRGAGFQRVANGRADIGAFEKQENSAALASQGAGAPIVTLESPAGTALTQVTALPEPDPADVVVPSGEFARFPVGTFTFQVGVAQGAAAEVVLYVPTGLLINAYYKQSPADGKWYKFTDARFEDRNGDGTADVVLPLTDGGSGDSDGQANGVIIDPGAPAYQALPIQIDIKPGDATNSTNLASQGVISVAILSTAGFDARWVNVASVLFAGARAASYVQKDVNGDGRLDLVLTFRTQDTDLRALYEQMLADDINADGVLSSNHQQLQVALTGRTANDVFIEGVDRVDLFMSGKALRDMLAELAAAGTI
jgi:hypothetical protein